MSSGTTPNFCNSPTITTPSCYIQLCDVSTTCDGPSSVAEHSDTDNETTAIAYATGITAFSPDDSPPAYDEWISSFRTTNL